MKTVIFDLDGTISDSSGGVLQSINYALNKMGAMAINEAEVKRYIGPPLTASFSRLLETDDLQTLERAVQFFRDDYTTIGYKINHLYDGIHDAIDKLAELDYRLFIATTKKQDTASDVLEYFQIDHYFQGVYGGGTEIPKPQLIYQIMSEHKCLQNRSVMIGDTHYDIHAAKENSILSIGANWGFGSHDEISTADKVVELPEKLLETITSMIGDDKGGF